MDIQVKAKAVASGGEFAGAIWMTYFLLSIVVIGGILATWIVIPLYLIGYFWPVASQVADRRMRDGIRLLMAVQPWFDCDIQLDLPGDGKGCLLVSNHRSHLDAFILLSRIQGIRILAKSALFLIPGLGVMMRLSKQIPVERGNVQSFLRAMDDVRDKLVHGEVVHVFPEMTRAEPGFQGTQNFSVSPFHAAFQAGAQVVPIVFEGTDETWPKSGFGIRYRRPIRVRSLAPLDPKGFAGSEELMLEARRRITQALTHGVAK